MARFFMLALGTFADASATPHSRGIGQRGAWDTWPDWQATGLWQCPPAALNVEYKIGFLAEGGEQLL